MDNFHFVDVKPTIDRAQTASIKDAIFRRAKEKAGALTTETSENYTTQVQNDVMEIARESIEPSPMNPFNQFIENIGLKAEVKTEPEIVKENRTTPTVDIEEIYTREIKRNIESVSNKVFTQSVKDETMTAARNQFRQQTNLMATLNFLNTQAAIKMAENAHSKINYLS